MSEHVNGEVDVLIVGVTGVGCVTVDGRVYPLRAGVVVLILHRRRGPLRIGRPGDH